MMRFPEGTRVVLVASDYKGKSGISHGHDEKSGCLKVTLDYNGRDILARYSSVMPKTIPMWRMSKDITSDVMLQVMPRQAKIIADLLGLDLEERHPNTKPEVVLEMLQASLEDA